MEARISDFGLSKIFEKDGITHITTAIMGTRGYLDPEYVLFTAKYMKIEINPMHFLCF